MLKTWNGTSWIETSTPVSSVTVISSTPPADTSVNWEDDNIYDENILAIQQANDNLQSLVSQLNPTLVQAQEDLNTLANSTDPLAPIIARTVQGAITLAQGLADTLVALQVIAASEINKNGNG